MSTQQRREADSLGSVEVPHDAYWGVHTARALANFPIATERISAHRGFVMAYAAVKQAAARANRDLGALDPVTADLIDRACREVLEGRFHDQFVVGVLQGGAGTSTNMNVNEVVANIALELGGHRKGDYHLVHPLDDVNKGQSTNDTYPTALRLALRTAGLELLEELRLLRDAFSSRAGEFAAVVKMGRTQLQDAVPMTLGQEFGAFAHTLHKDSAFLDAALTSLDEVSLGGTAIGTGITATPGFGALAVAHLSEIVSRPLASAPDLVEATSGMGDFVALSGALKRSAVSLSKISSDLRLLSSGPQAGLNEIALPARQAGSSIMPGKVNPVIPESMNQVAFAVIGFDLTVTVAAEAGQLQLNAFGPIIAHSLLQGVGWLARACRVLRLHCVEGIAANDERLAATVRSSVGVVTALTPDIGYAAGATLAKQALATGRSVTDLVVEAGLMSRGDVVRALAPERLCGVAPSTVATTAAP